MSSRVPIFRASPRVGLPPHYAGWADFERRLLECVAPHARELGCERELEGVEDLLRKGNGAARQQMVYEANHDLHELMAEIVATTS
jgi:glutamate---cysteine ligase / carboxylate-amine ligase